MIRSQLTHTNRRMVGWLYAGLMLCFLIVAGQARAGDYKIEYYCLGNAYESCFLYFSGTIEPGLAEEIGPLLESSEAPTLFLNSPGGSLEEAIQVGRLIRESGIQTSVGSILSSNFDENGRPFDFPKGGACESACAYMFLGGRERSMGGGRLGVHRFYRSEGGLSSDEAQLVSGILVDYLVEMGVDARVLVAASRQGSEGMYYLSEKEGLEYDVITPRGWGELFLEPYLRGVVAASRRLDPAKPYDTVEQVTFFCDGGRPRILLTTSSTNAYEAFLDGERPIPRFEVSGRGLQSLTEASLMVRLGDSVSMLIIEMPETFPEDLSALRGEVHEFYVDVPFRRVSGGVRGARIEMSSMDRAMVGSAFRHCVR